MSSKSTRKRWRGKSTIDRPPKPYKDFPLSPANIGRWQKKINGTLYYFGRWGRVVNGKMTRIQDDGCWQAALEEYEQKRDALYAGRKPREKGVGLTVAAMCNSFLTSKLDLMESGEITARSFMEYQQTTDRLIAKFGRDRLVEDLDDADFMALRADIAKHWGPVRLGNEVQRVRTVFKHVKKRDLIPDSFKKPSKKVQRLNRKAGAKRLFTAQEIHALLGAASTQLKAMILLGINCGFGNGDCANLPVQALDLEAARIDYERPKTAVDRRCILWPETVEALKTAIAERPTPKKDADAGLVFITKYGRPWVRTQDKKKPDEKDQSKDEGQSGKRKMPRPQVPVDSVCLEFGKLLRSLKINGRRGLGFYALRHTFRTEADATKDFPAIRLIMGHADDSIDAVYREHIDDSRLRAVADHVRKWLFG